MSFKSRNRGRILTPEGLGRLQQAIRAWELENEMRCTQEKLRELTIAEKPPNGLDPGTISKILEAEKGVDPKSIRCLFKTLGLELDEADLVSASRSQLQVDSNFVGREGAIADLNALVNRGVKVIVIQARGGVGKTTLARKYLQQEFDSFLEFPIAKETKDIASIESLIEEKLRQLGEEPGREFFVSLDRLKRKLQNERTGILIDNLEPALDSAGKFIEPHRRYVELLRVLADPSVQSTTLITTRERLRESSITVENYILRSLDLTAWEQFFQSRDLSTATLGFAALHNAYGGNAKAMDIIRSAILEDYAGDVAAYWQANQHDLFIERDLEDLVTQQFDRLQQIDADAYNLLCRMGCYRYQDVPTVPIEGLLCLLWDVPENRQRRVVKALQDRSLVEFANGEYWLHPVIRSEAIGQLRLTKSLETANSNAATFWTINIATIESMEHALKAMEAYYHYIENRNFEAAANVIIREREEKWKDSLSFNQSLGYALYGFGFLRKVIDAVNSIIKHVDSKLLLSYLYLLLGDSYWMTGYIHSAIDYLEKSRRFAAESMLLRDIESSEYSSLNAINIHSLFNLGLCEMYLGESEKAIELFSQVSTDAEDTISHRFAVSSWCCLAFLNSLLGFKSEAERLLVKVHDQITGLKGSWYKIYGSVHLGNTYRNLGNLQKATALFLEANSHAEFSNRFHGKALALLGLAEIHREEKQFDKALSYYSEAIKILRGIEAECDLAEVYYRIGLNYQEMKAVNESNNNFQEAIRLFSKIGAPKQVERVRRSITHSEQLE